MELTIDKILQKKPLVTLMLEIQKLPKINIKKKKD